MSNVIVQSQLVSISANMHDGKYKTHSIKHAVQSGVFDSMGCRKDMFLICRVSGRNTASYENAVFVWMHNEIHDIE